MERSDITPSVLLAQAKQAVLAGDRVKAEALALELLKQDANNLDATLIMAGITEPQVAPIG